MHAVVHARPLVGRRDEASADPDHVAEDLGVSPKQQQQLLKLAHDGLAAQGQTFVAMNN